jgi:hypothetical protein
MPNTRGSEFQWQIIILLEFCSLPHAIEGNAHVVPLTRVATAFLAPAVRLQEGAVRCIKV